MVATVSVSFHPTGLVTTYRSVFEQDTEPGTCCASGPVKVVIQFRGTLDSVCYNPKPNKQGNQDQDQAWPSCWGGAFNYKNLTRKRTLPAELQRSEGGGGELRRNEPLKLKTEDSFINQSVNTKQFKPLCCPVTLGYWWKDSHTVL